MSKKLEFIQIVLIAKMLVLAVIFNTSYAQVLNTEINNYSFGSSQNWGIDTCENQLITVANNSGLSIFNGQFWSMYHLPKDMIIRSVLCYNGKIYTGSYEEFGYWQKNESGILKYNSLKSKFDANSPKQSEEFWEIISHGGSIFFRSFGAIYKYDGETISTITDSFNVSSLAEYKGELLFGSFSDGLFKIKDGKVVPFTEVVTLTNLKSVSVLSTYENLIFANDLDFGSYLFTDDKELKLPVPLKEALKEYTLNKVEFVDENTIAFGTVKNGVIIYKIDSNNYNIINRQNGIRNNTVLDIKYQNGFLWLALDNGVSKIDINSEYTYYNDASGTLGTVYDVAFFNNKYYLASNTGVYTFDNNELYLIENSEGHCWEILKYKDKLLFGHNRGAFVLDGNKLSQIPGSFSGVYNYLTIPKSNSLLISTYSGIGVLNNEKSNFSISKLTGIDVPVDKLIFENDTTLWATNNYTGLFKINFDVSKMEAKNIFRLNDNSIVGDAKVKFQAINNKLLFKIDNDWYTYSHKEEAFKPFSGLKNQTLLGLEDLGFWMLDKQNSSVIHYGQNFEIQNRLTNQSLVSKFVDGYEKIISKNDSIKIFNTKDGFALLNLRNIVSKSNIEPVVESIYANDAIIGMAQINDVVKLNHRQSRSITFEVYSPGKYGNALKYNLLGELNQGKNILDGKFSLQNLPAGDYVLDVFENGNPESSTKIQLKILPPWYLSMWMKILYLMLLLAIIYVTGKYQKRKAEKVHRKTQNRLLEEERRKIELIEKNNLINEVNSRKKELTNSTATIVKKNEAIILLRNELKRLERTSNNITRTKHILHKSGEHLDTKNDWQLFETKFNELNEDFFKKLSKQYPKLTTKDRKLCAYIKVGLTSKEIAPLLDITLRSVELQRYRLRKKLNLDTKITFNEFFRDF